MLVAVRGSHVESGRGVMGPDPHHYGHTGRSHTCRTPHVPLWGEYIVSIPWKKDQDNYGIHSIKPQINQSTKQIFVCLNFIDAVCNFMYLFVYSTA